MEFTFIAAFVDIVSAVTSGCILIACIISWSCWVVIVAQNLSILNRIEKTLRWLPVTDMLQKVIIMFIYHSVLHIQLVMVHQVIERFI